MVEGLIFYYPTKAGLPSKPDISAYLPNGVIDISEDLDKEDSETSFLCSVYWQDRLVPEAVLELLQFFPTKAKAKANHLPTDWKSRVHCFLFFDWRFKHISNNKLKFQVEPSLKEWFNKVEISKPARLSEEFIK